MSDSDKQYILDLHAQFAELLQQRRYAEALDVAETALREARQRFDEHNAFVSTSLKNASLAHRTLGDFAVAERLLKESMEIDRLLLGDRHRFFGETIFQLARLYGDMRRLDQAREEYVHGLEVLTEAYGGSGGKLAERYNEVGEFLFRSDDYATAASFLKEGLNIAVPAVGPEHPFVAVLLNNLGLCEKMTRDFESAEGHYTQSLAIRRTHFGAGHPVVAESLRNLALLRQAADRFSSAEELLTEALDILRLVLPPRHPQIAQTIGDLGALRHQMGDLPGAEPLIAEAVEIQRSRFGDTHPVVARSLGNLGALYLEMGRYADCERLLTEALEILREAFGETHPEVTTSLNNLARLHQVTGQYVDAERLYMAALTTRRNVLDDSDPRITTSLFNLASLYHDMGSRTAAYPLLKEALERARTTSGENSLEVALCLNNLAELYREDGQQELAEGLCRTVLRIRQEILGDEHPLVTATLNNLALNLGFGDEAESLLQEVLARHLRTFGEAHESVAQAYGNLAVHQYARGRHSEAKPNALRALQIVRSVYAETHPSVSRALTNAALVSAATNQPREALEYLQHAASIDDHLISQVFSIASEKQRMGLLGELWMNFSALLSLVRQTFPADPGAVSTAFDLVIRRKALGAEALDVQRDAWSQADNPQLADAIRELSILRTAIATQTLVGVAATDHEATRRRLDEWSARRDELEAKLAKQIPEMNLRQRLRRANRETVANALPAKSALVEYVRIAAPDLTAGFQNAPAPYRYVAFVLVSDEGQRPQLVDLGNREPDDGEPIDQAVAAFRAAITGGGRTFAAEVEDETLAENRVADVKRCGVALRKLVFDPLLSVLNGCRRLFLAADGDLSLLPFEALPLDDDRFVIDEYFISYLSSGRDVLRFGAAGARDEAGAAIVAADPDYDLAADETSSSATTVTAGDRRSRDLGRNTRFRRLPGARAEGETVAKLLGVTPWLGPEVLENRLKARRSPWILHLATHGAFLPDQRPGGSNEHVAAPMMGGRRLAHLSGLENPLLRSFLALAGANTWLRGKSLPDDAGDGMLNGEDVAVMDLRHTELVVLSACETGLGHVHVGEGVFGLRRAFVLAGAKTLVMSLWKVPDEETQQLMAKFYAAILAGQQRADALREAQLAIKKDRPDDPLYWGAFICQGEPWTLTSRTPPAE